MSYNWTIGLTPHFKLAVPTTSTVFYHLLYVTRMQPLSASFIKFSVFIVDMTYTDDIQIVCKSFDTSARTGHGF